MDYDVDMLRLYFKENNFTKEQIDYLLDINPFNREYLEWLKNRNITAKSLAIELTKRSLIHSNTCIQELTFNEDDKICKYLSNKAIISVTKKAIKFMPGYTILMRGSFNKQKKLITSFDEFNIPFIAGECTKNLEYYEKIKKYYTDIKEQLKNCELIESHYDDKNTCIIRSL